MSARVRRLYPEQADRIGVDWNRRDYAADDFAGGTPVNQALSAANTCLYGAVHAVVVALGCAPGLGFVHTGHIRSFVFDIADLYKAELTIPVAFDIAAAEYADIGAETQRAFRDRLRGNTFLDRCVRDVKHLLTPADAEPERRTRAMRMSSSYGTTTALHCQAGHRMRNNRDGDRGCRLPGGTPQPSHTLDAGSLPGRLRGNDQSTRTRTHVDARFRHGQNRTRHHGLPRVERAGARVSQVLPVQAGGFQSRRRSSNRNYSITSVKQACLIEVSSLVRSRNSLAICCAVSEI